MLSFKLREKKRVYATLRFSRVYFNRCHPGDHRKPGEKLQCKKERKNEKKKERKKTLFTEGGVH